MEHGTADVTPTCDGPSNFSKAWIEAIKWAIIVAGGIMLFEVGRVEVVADAGHKNTTDILLMQKDLTYIKQGVDELRAAAVEVVPLKRKNDSGRD